MPFPENDSPITVHGVRKTSALNSGATLAFLAICVTALSSCSRGDNPEIPVLDLTMPVCYNRTGTDWADPPYQKEIKFRIAETDLRMSPSPAEWPEGKPPANRVGLLLIRQENEVSSSVDNGKISADSGLNIMISNLPAGIDFKVDLLTDSNLREKMAGHRDGYVVMKGDYLPPYFRKPKPEYGFWVWERPEQWITEKQGLRTAKDTIIDTIFDRVFQPVGLEDKVVMTCSFHRYPPNDSRSCRVFTALDTGADQPCERIAMEYHFATSDMSVWRGVDTAVRKKVHALIQSPAVKFKTIDGS
jgi:hypothetical protein